MDSDSDSPFNYSWPSFPKMRMRRKTDKKEKSPSIRESQASSPTLAAVARLSAMMHGQDRVYANAMLVDQVDDADIRYRPPGKEKVSLPSHAGISCWNSFSTSAFDTGNCSQNPYPPSPDDQEPRDSQAPGLDNHREQSPRMSSPSPFASSPSFPSSPLTSLCLSEEAQRRQLQTYTSLSPGLNCTDCSLSDANVGLSPSLECDSGDEDILGHSYPCSSIKHRSILHSISGEERGSFDASPDFNRSHSDITPKTIKNSEDPEVRLRSYSYSSPKAKPSRPLLNRDMAITDLEEEQRAFSLTETPREKRIEDEEWDKYIIPSKVETEKYKVSRTFSFLKNRMSSTRNKTKVKGKDMKEGKDRTGAMNGHQFVPVSQSTPALCAACDKPVSGKELLQCSSCFVNVHKNCRESVAACGKVAPQLQNQIMKCAST
uniref:Phorbol-ester/DAG-type domain-containing protein n=1 Tax=Oryzias latipes TaxID=8090 RepID=A0A3B3I260_ORYLA